MNKTTLPVTFHTCKPTAKKVNGMTVGTTTVEMIMECSNDIARSFDGAPGICNVMAEDCIPQGEIGGQGKWSFAFNDGSGEADGSISLCATVNKGIITYVEESIPSLRLTVAFSTDKLATWWFIQRLFETSTMTITAYQTELEFRPKSIENRLALQDASLGDEVE